MYRTTIFDIKGRVIRRPKIGPLYACNEGLVDTNKLYIFMLCTAYSVAALFFKFMCRFTISFSCNHSFSFSISISFPLFLNNFLFLNRLFAYLIIYISIKIIYAVQFMEIIGIKGRSRSGGFLSVFTIAFLLFLAPAGGSNPARHSLNLT